MLPLPLSNSTKPTSHFLCLLICMVTLINKCRYRLKHRKNGVTSAGSLNKTYYNTSNKATLEDERK